MVDAAAHDLATNLRQLREIRGVTQDQAARLAGVPRATWGSLETGAANPTLAALVKVGSCRRRCPASTSSGWSSRRAPR